MIYPKTVDDIAHELQGSASSLESVLEYNGMEAAGDDQDFLQALDQLVFCCDDCGWWCEISEMIDTGDSSEQVCDDCGEEAE